MAKKEIVPTTKSGIMAALAEAAGISKKQGARTVRNPQTGATIKKPACKVAKFRLAKAAKDAVLAK